MTTKRGINIGSLFVIDPNPGNGLTREQEDFLGTIASSCMTYLETNREAAEGRRATRFSHGLNLFVEGRSSFASDEARTTTPENLPAAYDGPGSNKQMPRSNSKRASRSDSETSTALNDARKQTDMSSHKSPRASNEFTFRGKARDNRDASSSLEMVEPQDTVGDDMTSGRQGQRDHESRGHPRTFSRAANLLRESLEIDSNGGVVFFDANSGLVHRSGQDSSPTTASDAIRDSEGTRTVRKVPKLPSELNQGQDQVIMTTSFDPATNTFKSSRSLSNVLASSTAKKPFAPGDNSLVLDVNWQLDHSFLRELLRRYPKGKLWAFDQFGSLPSSEEDYRPSSALGTQRQSQSQWKSMETSMLKRLFSGVRNLLFAPLWDASISQWNSGCFCWNTVDTRVFNSATELSFLMAFGTSLMTECSRLDTLTSDQQKGDFIGSIS